MSRTTRPADVACRSAETWSNCTNIHVVNTKLNSNSVQINSVHSESTIKINDPNIAFHINISVGSIFGSTNFAFWIDSFFWFCKLEGGMWTEYVEGMDITCESGLFAAQYCRVEWPWIIVARPPCRTRRQEFCAEISSERSLSCKRWSYPCWLIGRSAENEWASSCCLGDPALGTRPFAMVLLCSISKSVPKSTNKQTYITFFNTR